MQNKNKLEYKIQNTEYTAQISITESVAVVRLYIYQIKTSNIKTLNMILIWALTLVGSAVIGNSGNSNNGETNYQIQSIPCMTT